MNKEFDVSCEKEYTSDSVVERGYKIYDEWNSFGFSSKKIVAFVERAVTFAQAKGSHFYYVQALSYLFALDMRVREKYNKFWKCLLFYFSWRRETNALRRNKNTLHIAESADFRMAIEVEIQRLREKLENEELNGKDDDTHGGKRNAKAEEEAVAKQADPQEQASEESLDEEIVENEDSKEVSEETPEEAIEQIPTEETIENTEVLQDSLQEVVKEEVLPLKEKKQDELKVENNAPDEESEPIVDQPKPVNTYKETVDSPQIYENRESVSKINAEPTSIIDEVIIDNMVKNKENFGYRNSLADTNGVSEISQSDNTAFQNAEDNKTNGKDAYLYDKMLALDKDGELKQPDTKQVLTQNNVRIEENKSAKDELRVPLQVDINENQIIEKINNNMSNESKEAYYNWQADIMREQLNIASEELGMDAPIDIIERSEPTQIIQPSVAPNKK